MIDFTNAIEVLKPLKVFHNTRIALSQLSVWILAVAIIPPLCNAIIAPFMKKFSPKNNTSIVKTPEQEVLNSKFLAQYNNDVLKNKAAFASFQNYPTNYSTGMRI